MSRILESIGKCLDKALSCLLSREKRLPGKNESDVSSKLIIPPQADTEALRGDWRQLTSDMKQAVYHVIR